MQYNYKNFTVINLSEVCFNLCFVIYISIVIYLENQP